MATDLQSGASGAALAEKPKVLGLFSMVLFSVSAILVADTVASSAAVWAITGGGTAVSLLIGWWLYWQASRKAGA